MSRMMRRACAPGELSELAFIGTLFLLGPFCVSTQTLFSLSQRAVDALDCCQRALDVGSYVVGPLLINY